MGQLDVGNGGVGKHGGGVIADHGFDQFGVPYRKTTITTTIVETNVVFVEVEQAHRGAVAYAGGQDGWSEIAVIELFGKLFLLADIFGDIGKINPAWHQIDIAGVFGVLDMANATNHRIGLIIKLVRTTARTTE